MNSLGSSQSSVSHEGLCNDTSALRRQANILGYAGLIPFLTLAALYPFVQGDIQQPVGRALVAYGAVIISFLGACHWGAAVTGIGRSEVPIKMLFAVSPALLGWLAMLLPLFHGFLLIIGGLLITYLGDSHWYYGHTWYLTLRRRLTLIASLCVAFTAVPALYGI